VSQYADKDVRWSSQGMLRLTQDAMRTLFQSTVDNIHKVITSVLDQPKLTGLTAHLHAVRTSVCLSTSRLQCCFLISFYFTFLITFYRHVALFVVYIGYVSSTIQCNNNSQGC